MIYQNLPEAEIKMLISCYETKLLKIVKPLQRFETGLFVGRYRDDDGLKKCMPVDFNHWMEDHNYRVSLGTPDTLTDIVYTRKFINYMVYKEWYLTEMRAKYNDFYSKVEMLAEFVGYDYSYLVGQLNFTKEEQASMDAFREKNARNPLSYVGTAFAGRDWK